MTTNSSPNFSNSGSNLYMAIELSASNWKLGFADCYGRKPRVRTIQSGDMSSLQREIASAKKVFELDADCPTISSHEAGRDGFWVHRGLVTLGIESHIVDPASIEVNRKKRRAKTDRIDAQRIVTALMRFKSGDRFACRMIRIPTPEAEDARQLNREMRIIKNERTAHTNRIKSLLVTQGITGVEITRHFATDLDALETADGRALGEQLKERLLREFERLALATEQIRTLQMKQASMLRFVAKQKDRQDSLPKAAVIAEHLSLLRGLGPVGSWTLSTEVFAWRDIVNRRQLGALIGLTPTPNDSGDEEKEQGISKSGRGELRVLMIELAWLWIVYQPDSELTKWYKRRFDDGTKRNRKIGIVALARKLLVALGKYVRGGEIPAGARLTEKFVYSYLPSLRS